MLRTSQVEAPEEILRRLARERREANVIVSPTLTDNARNDAIAWLLAEGERIKAEHITNLSIVLKRLITKYLEYVVSIAQIGLLGGRAQIAALGIAQLVPQEVDALSPRGLDRVAPLVIQRGQIVVEAVGDDDPLVREATQILRTSRRESVRSFARCLKTCLRKAIDKFDTITAIQPQ